MKRRATGRLLFAALISVVGALAALLGGIPEAALLAAPWAVLLALGFTRLGPAGANAAVEVSPNRLVVGDEVEIAAHVSNAVGSVHVTCLPSDGFWPGSPNAEQRRAAELHDVLVGDRAAVRCNLTASQWGVHDVGHVKIEITEPYGLFRWSGWAGQSIPVRVHPSTEELQQLLAPWLVRSVTGAHDSKVVGRGVEYADVRQYSSGDSLREINWQASARSEDLWVSQRHPDQATDVVLLLDSFIEGGHDVRKVVGLAIEGLMALASSHLVVADRVGLVELGGMVRWVTPGTGKLHLQRLVDTVLSTRFLTHVADRDINLTMSHALPPRSFVVALTPLLDDRFIEALFVLGGHGHDVSVVECDIHGSSNDEDEAASLGLARRLWEAERQIVRDRLAERGITVARWSSGDHLDLTLAELSRRRRGVVRARHG